MAENKQTLQKAVFMHLPNWFWVIIMTNLTMKPNNENGLDNLKKKVFFYTFEALLL